MADAPRLKQNLKGWQIFFIAISAVIGSGIFTNDGSALEVAGPGGALLALLVMGIVAIAVMEGVSEFTQLFPAPNAIVEYVKAFVDEDFGWVVGIAYWYTYSALFALQNLSAASLSRYWGLSQTWQTVIFYFLAPAVIVCINYIGGVATFGIIESIGGLLKVILVFGSAILMYVIAARDHNGDRINDGLQSNTSYASNHSKAVCYVIPLIAYSFLGIEVVAVTAFEARSSQSLRLPSQIIAYVTFGLYLMCLLGEVLNVKWNDPHLPRIYDGVGSGATDVITPQHPRSNSMLIIATWNAGMKNMTGFLTGCLIFSVLSASNTSLYVASRTLYGLTREIPKTNWIGRQLNKISVVENKTGVPIASLIISAISFFWLPFVQLKSGYEVIYLVEIMAVSTAVSNLIVWAALSLAFIRYIRWLKKCDSDIAKDYPEYKRDSPTYKPYTVLRKAQPVPAWIGMLGCFMVFGFASATWWDTPVTFSKVAVAYAAPIILLPLWILFKIINRRKWVVTGNNMTVLAGKLSRLKWYKRDEDEARRPHEEALRDLAPLPEAPQDQPVAGPGPQQQEVV